MQITTMMMITVDVRIRMMMTLMAIIGTRRKMKMAAGR